MMTMIESTKNGTGIEGGYLENSNYRRHRGEKNCIDKMMFSKIESPSFDGQSGL
jgi:hypothetical protein